MRAWSKLGQLLAKVERGNPGKKKSTGIDVSFMGRAWQSGHAAHRSGEPDRKDVSRRDIFS